MRRADRLFDVIQVLRTAKKPVTAATLAEELEVTVRTIYRDVATLQARRVPIEGAPGLGYVLRKGFDLPPLMFTIDEIEAIAVGARMVQRVRDSELQHAAARVLDKVTVVLPESLRGHVADAPVYVSRGDAVEPKVDMAQVRAAIRDRRKLRIAYVDEKGHRTRRTIWPLAMAYYVDVSVVGAWCELRKDLRNFRVERIASSRMLAARFQDHNGRLLAQWLALPKERPPSRGVRIEPRRRQPGEAGLGELRAIELEERRGNGVEAEGIAFLQNDAGKLAPDFDDEGFGQVMLDSVLDHGADLPVSSPTWSRSDERAMVEVAESVESTSK